MQYCCLMHSVILCENKNPPGTEVVNWYKNFHACTRRVGYHLPSKGFCPCSISRKIFFNVLCICLIQVMSSSRFETDLSNKDRVKSTLFKEDCYIYLTTISCHISFPLFMNLKTSRVSDTKRFNIFGHNLGK